jgi:glycine cleavage system aminomethyltransferase T
VIARLNTYNKIQRKLVGLKLSDPLEFNNGQIVIQNNGEESGKLTSYTMSYKLNSPIGLAYIRNSHLTNDNQITLKLSDGKLIKAQVHPLPFVK